MHPEGPMRFDYGAAICTHTVLCDVISNSSRVFLPCSFDSVLLGNDRLNSRVLNSRGHIG
jgi:hypothetical protein